MPQLLFYLGVDSANTSSNRFRRKPKATALGNNDTAHLAHVALQRIESASVSADIGGKSQQQQQHDASMLTRLDWGVLAVYTCPQDCDPHAVIHNKDTDTTRAPAQIGGYTEEWIYRQQPMDQCDDTFD